MITIDDVGGDSVGLLHPKQPDRLHLLREAPEGAAAIVHCGRTAPPGGWVRHIEQGSQRRTRLCVSCFSAYQKGGVHRVAPARGTVGRNQKASSQTASTRSARPPRPDDRPDSSPPGSAIAERSTPRPRRRLRTYGLVDLPTIASMLGVSEAIAVSLAATSTFPEPIIADLYDVHAVDAWQPAMGAGMTEQPSRGRLIQLGLLDVPAIGEAFGASPALVREWLMGRDFPPPLLSNYYDAEAIRGWHAANASTVSRRLRERELRQRGLVDISQLAEMYWLAPHAALTMTREASFPAPIVSGLFDLADVDEWMMNGAGRR